MGELAAGCVFGIFLGEILKNVIAKAQYDVIPNWTPIAIWLIGSGILGFEGGLGLGFFAGFGVMADHHWRKSGRNPDKYRIDN